MKNHFIIQDAGLHKLAKQKKLKEFTRYTKRFNPKPNYDTVVITIANGWMPTAITLKCLGVEIGEKTFTVRVGKVLHIPLTIKEKWEAQRERDMTKLKYHFEKLYNGDEHLSLKELAEQYDIKYSRVVNLFGRFNKEKITQ